MDKKFENYLKGKGGYVYVCRNTTGYFDKYPNSNNIYKIGMTKQNDVDERIKKAKTSSSFLFEEAELAVDPPEYFPNSDIQEIEKNLHEQFKKDRLSLKIKGTDGEEHKPEEWFCVPLEEIIEAIKHQKLMAEAIDHMKKTH